MTPKTTRFYPDIQEWHEKLDQHESGKLEALAAIADGCQEAHLELLEAPIPREVEPIEARGGGGEWRRPPLRALHCGDGEPEGITRSANPHAHTTRVTKRTTRV